jgi:pullulanase
MRPLLALPQMKPAPADIRFARDGFMDLLRIRTSSSLFRLQTADEVASRLTLHNTGPAQTPTAVVGQLDGRGVPGARFAEVLYAIHVGKEPLSLDLPTLKGRAYKLHPVHLAPTAADKRPAEQSSWNAATGKLTLPPRTALVYVLD